MLKNKIISSDKDLIGLVFFGTVSIMFAFTVSIKALVTLYSVSCPGAELGEPFGMFLSSVL